MSKASKEKVKLEDGIYNAYWRYYDLTILSNEDHSELVTIKSIMGVLSDSMNEKVEIENGIVSFYYK